MSLFANLFSYGEIVMPLLIFLVVVFLLFALYWCWFKALFRSFTQTQYAIPSYNPVQLTSSLFALNIQNDSGMDSVRQTSRPSASTNNQNSSADISVPRASYFPSTRTAQNDFSDVVGGYSGFGLRGEPSWDWRWDWRWGNHYNSSTGNYDYSYDYTYEYTYE